MSNITSYTTPKGLTFSLYQDLDQTGVGDMSHNGVDNIQQCLDQCAMLSGQLCGAAAFDSTTNQCFYKNSNVTENGAVSRTGWTLAIANRIQIQQLPLTCTNNGQTEATQNGLNFTVYCNQDFSGSDLCSDDNPGCRAHTSTLGDCLNLCSTMHPLCTTVTWEPTLEHGFQNCYPKNATVQVFDKLRSSKTSTQIAKALLSASPGDCQTSSNATVLASNKEAFTLACDEDYPGNNLTVLHAQSRDSCIDSCAGTAGKEGKCVGAVFDANMGGGYENCYLKSAIGRRLSGQSGFIFALRQDGTSNSTLNSPTSPPKKSPNRALIVGPVIGSIAGLAILFSLVWWWRLRRKREEQSNIKIMSQLQQENLLGNTPELSAEGQKYELDGTSKRGELGGTVGR